MFDARGAVEVTLRSFIPALLLILPAAGQYAGSQACRNCHAARFEEQSKSGHARALHKDGDRWAFGAGEQAITYVTRVDDDSYLEHGLSFYARTKALARTPGHADANGARYRTFEPKSQIMRCFQCHSTGKLLLAAHGTLIPGEPGVRCESCHGPGAAHVRAGGGTDNIFNPSRLDAAGINRFCGNCHRQPPVADAETDWNNPWNVRHQPPYLGQSRCFLRSQGKLSCLTCHSPHTALQRDVAVYDRRCEECHPGVKHRTRTAGARCVSCHMPVVEAGTLLRFTNHWIGVHQSKSIVPVR